MPSSRLTISCSHCDRTTEEKEKERKERQGTLIYLSLHNTLKYIHTRSSREIYLKYLYKIFPIHLHNYGGEEKERSRPLSFVLGASSISFSLFHHPHHHHQEHHRHILIIINNYAYTYT